MTSSQAFPSGEGVDMGLAHRVAQRCMDARSSGVCGEEALCGQPQHEQQSPALCRHAHALACGCCNGRKELLCMQKMLCQSIMAHRCPARAVELSALLAHTHARPWLLL